MTSVILRTVRANAKRWTIKSLRRWALMSLVSATSVAHAQSVMKKAWGVGPGFGIDAIKAQTQMKSSCATSGVIVAVIDTGIDTTHPALKNVLWTNEKEAKGKMGVDNDGNGFINDIHGWDFVRNTGHLEDFHGHGSHISGIIAGNGQDSESFKGVCPGVRIMALRYYDPNGSGDDNLKNTIKAINYAVDNGATIINYSGGGAEFSAPEYAALKRAEKKGILVVAAAGNERSDADHKLYFPSAYNLSNMISVTAIDEHGVILPSSNWGLRKVQVGAPGQSILSTLPSGNYGFMSGTSQATAFVTGVAAMLWSENRTLSVDKLKTIIEASSIKYSQLIGKTKTGGRVNAVSALDELSKEKRSLSSEGALPASSLANSQNSLVSPKKALKTPLRKSQDRTTLRNLDKSLDQRNPDQKTLSDQIGF